MPHVRKSYSCRISAIFFKVLFYDWNPSSNDNFSFFRLFFSMGKGFIFQMGGLHFYVGGRAWGVSLVLMEGDWKNHRVGGPPPPMPPPHYVKSWLCNPPTFNITKTSEWIELLPLSIDDRKVFMVKVKVNIAGFWQRDEFSATHCDPVNSGKWN